jgi:RNA polymerase sigma-70 factor (ECF subfamily)
VKISELTDEQLVQHYIESNDVQYYLQITNRYQEPLFGVCFRFLNDLNHAQTAAINIKNRLKKDIRSYSGKNFKTWLHEYVKKECIQQLELQNIAVPPTLLESFRPEEQESLFDPSVPAASLESLINCLETLPENQQLTIKLFYLKEMSMTEIEKATGMEMYKIKNYLQKGRKNLKTCMLQYQSNN